MVTKKINTKKLAKLEAATCIGKDMVFKDKANGKRGSWGTVKDEVYIMVSDYKHMIQRIRYHKVCDDGSRYGYRACYYTLDGTGQHVKFGQFAQQLSERQYQRLLGKAKKKGWRLF